MFGETSYLVTETIWTKSVATVGAESWDLQWSISSLLLMEYRGLCTSSLERKKKIMLLKGTSIKLNRIKNLTQWHKRNYLFPYLNLIQQTICDRSPCKWEWGDDPLKVIYVG